TELSANSFSLSDLYKKANKKIFSIEKPIKFSAYFHKKIALLFVPFLIVLGIAPFCLAFSRNIQVFFVSLFSLFGWISFYTIMESALIFGSQSLFSPAWIIWGAFFPFLLFSLYKFAKLE
ncbi:MAG: LptF/LptG family permease, partial [Chlamydiota bacterium]